MYQPWFFTDEIGNPPRKRTKRAYRDLQKRLQNLSIAYAEGRKSLQDFLQEVLRETFALVIYKLLSKYTCMEVLK